MNGQLDDVIGHILNSIKNAGLKKDPFPHFESCPVFPGPYYKELLVNLPDDDAYTPAGETGLVTSSAYKERGIISLEGPNLANLPDAIRPFWIMLSRKLLARAFMEQLVEPFDRDIKMRFAEKTSLSIWPNAYLCRDWPGYSLGPHTDSYQKVVSLIFYLPENTKSPELGTSLYIPRDRDFKCEGGPHYNFADFTRVKTLPYIPNTVFGFVKSTQSFHGVEPLCAQHRSRDVLLYNVYQTMKPSA